MADDLDETIRENAQGPAKATGDSGSMEHRRLPGSYDNQPNGDDRDCYVAARLARVPIIP